MWQWWKRWGIVVTSLAWLVHELWNAFDDDPHTRPLTYVVVESVPVWLYVPAAALLALWIVPHFWSAGRDVARGLSRKKRGSDPNAD